MQPTQMLIAMCNKSANSISVTNFLAQAIKFQETWIPGIPKG